MFDDERLLLPRIPDTLGEQEVYAWSERAITKWVYDHFDAMHEWVWFDKLNCKFRLLGRQLVYQLRRYGKFFEVYVVY